VVAAFDLSVSAGSWTWAAPPPPRRRGLPALPVAARGGFDLPGVVPMAREQVQASPVAGVSTCSPGDFFQDPLPEADLYALDASSMMERGQDRCTGFARSRTLASGAPCSSRRNC